MSSLLLICFCSAMRGTKSLTKEKWYDLIDAFNSTSRYLDDLLNIDDFNFDIVNFPFLDGDVPQRPSYGVYISHFIHFARASSHVTDFQRRSTCKFMTEVLQGWCRTCCVRRSAICLDVNFDVIRQNSVRRVAVTTLLKTLVKIQLKCTPF